MRSVNKVIIIGNLTRNPEMRQTPNGQNVTTFGLATNREWMTQDGEKKNSAEFHECVAWARLAEICDQYLKKGALVYVEGYLKTRSWETPEGVKKFKTEIVVQDMIMLEKRQSRDDEIDEPVASAPKTEKAEEPTETETPEEKTEEQSRSEAERPSKTENEEETKKPEQAEESTEPKEATDSEEESPIDKDLGL